MTVEATLSEREKTHGSFREHAITCQSFKQVYFDSFNYTTGNLSCQHKEAIEMILHKLARVLSGDPNHKDHWHDIQGYAKLAEDA